MLDTPDSPVAVARRTPGERLSDRIAEGRENHFGLIRLGLSLVVFAFHCLFPLAAYGRWVDPIGHFTGGVFHSGNLAVGGFFVISGYLITSSWLRDPRLAPYLSKRAARIYPGYLAALVLSVVAFGPLLVDDHAAYWRGVASPGFLASALLIRLDFPDPFMRDVAGTFWSIGYEVWCYVAVVALGLLGAFKRPAFALAALLGCLALIALQVGTGFSMPGAALHRVFGWPNKWPSLMAFFLAGSCLQLFRSRVPYSGWLALACPAGAVALAWYSPARGFLVGIPVLLAYPLIYAAYLPGEARSLSPKGPGVDLSYGIYLYGVQIQELAGRHFGPHLNPISMFFLLLPVVCLVAYASWRMVEEPFLRPARKAEGARGPKWTGIAATWRSKIIPAISREVRALHVQTWLWPIASLAAHLPWRKGNGA